MYQFNRFIGGGFEAHLRLARQRIIMLDILARTYDIRAIFKEATGGITLERYFEVLSLLLAHLEHGMTSLRRWMTRDSLCAQVRANRDEIERIILNDWAQSPAQYKEEVEAWRRGLPAVGFVPSFDYMPLKVRPIVEARPGEYVCPVVPYLVSKIEDGAYYVVAEHLGNSAAERQRFFTKLGEAYEEYARGLVHTLSTSDRSGWWAHVPSPKVDGDEVTDDYLSRAPTVVCFEHKAGRPSIAFLRGGPGDRVVGPANRILEQVDSGNPISHEEGRDADEGFLTKGLWQLSLSGRLLPRLTQERGDEQPKCVYPVITHLSGIAVDRIVNRIYMAPLRSRTKLLAEEYWRAPQWMHVSDLEWLVGLAEEGELDLEELLREKCEGPQVDERFDIFLDQRGTIGRTPGFLREAAVKLVEEARAAFFPGVEDRPAPGGK